MGTRIEKIVGCATCLAWLIEPVVCFGHALQNGKKFNANFSPNDMLRGYRASEEFSGELPEIVAELSFVDADAMMIEREKNTFNQ